MAHQRLRHDVAAATAKAILDIVAPCLRPEEQREAWGMFVTAITAGLEKYDELRRTEMKKAVRGRVDMTTLIPCPSVFSGAAIDAWVMAHSVIVYMLRREDRKEAMRVLANCMCRVFGDLCDQVQQQQSQRLKPSDN